MEFRSQRVAASFRDRAGFVYTKGQRLLRQVNASYQQDYDQFVNSGLKAELIESGFLVENQEVSLEDKFDDRAYKILEATPVTFVSYPYEWCFSQLRDAALLTLTVQKLALARGMILKDATPFNVLFEGAQPIFIDVLSFEKYVEGAPWVAYRQFCEAFLLPLALTSQRGSTISGLLKSELEGLRLDRHVKFLPTRTIFKFGIFIHLYVHAWFSKSRESKSSNDLGGRVTKQSLNGLVASLESCVRSLSAPVEGKFWKAYYQRLPYEEAEFKTKAVEVGKMMALSKVGSALDLGCNTGYFSEKLAEKGFDVVAVDSDPGCVESLYLRLDKGKAIQPLILDITNPSPGCGWMNQERTPFLGRKRFDLCLALALVHHLVLTGNLELSMLAKGFHKMATTLIIEFVTKEDPQAQALLKTKSDIFTDYSIEQFENEFSMYFEFESKKTLIEGRRFLYFMRAK